MDRTRTRWLVSLLVAGLLATLPAGVPAAWAQDAADEQAEPVLVSNVYLDTDLREALADLAAQAGTTVIADESVQGFVTLELNEVPFEKALDLLLLAGGFIWEEVQDGVYLVTKPDPESPTFARIARTEVVQLRNITADELRRRLPVAYERFVRFDEVANLAIITAPTQLLQRVAQVIDTLDTPRPAAEEVRRRTEIVELAHPQRDTLLQLLPEDMRSFVTFDADGNRVIINAPTDRVDEIRTRVQALDQPTQSVRYLELRNAPGSVVQALLPERLRGYVSGQAESNLVVVTAPPRLLDSVVGYVEDLDARLGQTPLRTEVVELDYARGAELAPLLPASYQNLVRFDEATDRYVVSGLPQTVDEVVAFIRTLDRPPVQVMIEALVVEASRDDLREFSAAVQGEHLGLNTRTGLITYVEQAAAVLGQLLWLAERDRATIKASPRVVTQEGKEASFQVTLEQYFELITGRAGFEYVTLESVESPIGLTITPRVALDDGMVTCVLQPEVSDVVGQGTNNLPIITRRTAQTTVRVQDGQVIAIGGLLQELNREIERKIPILGDIPLLGSLFRSTDSQTSQREVIIFVVPHILNPDGGFDGPLLFERAAALGAPVQGPDAPAEPAPQATAPAPAPARPGRRPDRPWNPHAGVGRFGR